MIGINLAVVSARRSLFVPLLTLNALTLSASTVAENANSGTLIGTIAGRTSGSTLSLVYTAGGRVALDGLDVEVGGASNYEVTPSFGITIRETLAGYYTRDTALTITVTDVGEGGSPGTWLYDSSVTETDFNFIHSDDPDPTSSVVYVGRSNKEMPTEQGVEFNSGGTYVVQVGDTVTGATSGASGLVDNVNLNGTDWAGGNAYGQFRFSSQTGTFLDPENLNVGANLNVATVTNLSTQLNKNQDVYLFRISFTDMGSVVDLHMDEAFGSEALAQVYVDKVAPRVGKLPPIIRANLKHVQVTVNDGDIQAESVGHFFVLRKDKIDTRIANNDLEETCFHEGVHATLQQTGGGLGVAWFASPEWAAAVAADAKFITQYGAGSTQEDFAESALFAYTMLLHPERFPEPDRTQIAAHIPNRITFWADVFDI